MDVLARIYGDPVPRQMIQQIGRIQLWLTLHS